MDSVQAVLHAATLHQPHLASHDSHAFVHTNVTGTLTLLEAAARARVQSFVFTSTTSVFGHAIDPRRSGATAWITEEVGAEPTSIYGATKIAAEELCGLFHREHGLPCLVLRVSRFFATAAGVDGYEDGNVKVNELLFRRVDVEDAVRAHLLAMERAPQLGFARYVISATTPLTRSDRLELATDAPRVVARLFPDYEAEYARRGWRMFPGIDRVYVNNEARKALGWHPRYDFRFALDRLKVGQEPRSGLARAMSAEGAHPAREPG
jgi:UDP-glucose 4-epimerase